MAQVRHDHQLAGVAAAAERRARVVDQRVPGASRRRRQAPARRRAPSRARRPARPAAVARGSAVATSSQSATRPGRGSGASAAQVPEQQRAPRRRHRVPRWTTWRAATRPARRSAARSVRSGARSSRAARHRPRPRHQRDAGGDQHGGHDQQRVQRDRVQVHQRRDQRHRRRSCRPAPAPGPSVTTRLHEQVPAQCAPARGRGRWRRTGSRPPRRTTARNRARAAPADRAAALRPRTDRVRRRRRPGGAAAARGPRGHHHHRALRGHGPACQQAVAERRQAPAMTAASRCGATAPRRWRQRCRRPPSHAKTAATIAMCRPEIAIRWLVPLRDSASHCSRLTASCRPTASPATMPADGRPSSAARIRSATAARASSTGDCRQRLCRTTAAFTVADVATGADAVAQHARGVVLAAGIGETARSPQLDLEHQRLGGVDPSPGRRTR